MMTNLPLCSLVPVSVFQYINMYMNILEEFLGGCRMRL